MDRLSRGALMLVAVVLVLLATGCSNPTEPQAVTIAPGECWVVADGRQVCS